MRQNAYRIVSGIPDNKLTACVLRVVIESMYTTPFDQRVRLWMAFARGGFGMGSAVLKI